MIRVDPRTSRLTKVFVHLDRLTHNLRLLQEQVGGRAVWPVVKGDAYGHGAQVIARHLVELGYHTVGVADLEEAVALVDAGIEATIIVLSASLPEHSEALVAYGCEPVVCTLEMAESLARAAQQMGTRAVVHVKLIRAWGASASAQTKLWNFSNAAAICRRCTYAG